jgi:predicted enzyme related to lactoylglutathione lyase
MALSTVWIEFPVKDIERALKFYKAIFDCDGEITDDGERKTATILNMSETQPIGISLNQTANFEPSDKGAYVYLTNGDDDLSGMLAKVEGAGGKALTGKVSMGQAGFYATVQDTEGNVFGLYSQS